MDRPAPQDPKPMPAAAAAARPSPSRKKVKRRLNARAAIVLGALVLVLVAVIFLVSYLPHIGGSKVLLTQAQAVLKSDQPDLALKFLNTYLEQAPHDLQALEMRSKLLADMAHNGAQVNAAIAAAEFLVRLNPEGPGRQETRRRLVEMSLRKEQFGEVEDYQTIAARARDLIERDAKAGTSDARDHRLLARALLGLAKVDAAKWLPQAVEQFEKAAKLDPGDVVGATALATLYRDRLKQPAKADAVLDALLKANPKPEARLARYFQYARAGRRQKALAELSQAIKAAPENLEVRLVAADDALKHDDTATARRHLDAIPEATAATDVRARLLRGMLELRENHADDAIANWRRALELTSGNDPELTLRLAEVLLQLGRMEAAFPLMDQYLRINGGKKTPSYRFLEATRDIKSNQPAQAIAILENIRDEMPESSRAQVFLALGQCYELTGNPAKAIEAYREASKVAPNMARPRLRLSQLIEAASPGPAGREAARDEVRRGLTLAPEDLGLLLALARLHFEDRDWPAMKQVLDRAEAVVPDEPNLTILRADYLAANDDLNGAVALLSKAAQKGDRRNASLWIAWATALAKLGHPEEAVGVVERASAPEAAGDRAAIRVVRAQLQVQSGHGKQAREELDRNLNNLPPSERPTVLRAKADLLAQQGLKAEALATVLRLTRLLPEDPTPALQLLDQAVADRDEPAAAAAVEALSRVKRANGVYELIGRAYELIRFSPPDLPPAKRSERLDEAEALVEKVKAQAPRLPEASSMRGLLLERRALIADAAGDAARRDALLDRAIAAYKDAMGFGGGQGATNRLVELLARRKRLGDIDELRQRVPSPREFDRMLTLTALGAGLDDLARQTADRMLKGDPESLDVAAFAANVQKRVGEPKEAAKILRSLAEARQDEPGPWFQLLMFQAGRGETEEAVKTANEISKRVVKGTHPEFLHAQAYRVAGDAKRAAELYRVSLKKWPKDSGVVRAAADFFDSIGDSQEAQAVLQRALADDPSASWAARQLAMILSARTKDSEAWKKSWDLVRPGTLGGSDAPEDRLARAVVLLRSPDPAVSAEAVEALKGLKDDLPRKNPVGAEARNLLVRFFMDAGQTPQARELALEAATDSGEPDPGHVALYAEALLRDKKADAARKQVEHLAEMEPEALRTAVLRARLLQVEGKKDEAATALEDAFAAREHGDDGAQAAGQVVSALLDAKQLDAAERVARRETELRPADGWMLAQVLAAGGQVKEALAACLIAVERTGSRPAAQTALSLAAKPGAAPETVVAAADIISAARKRSREDMELHLMMAQVRHLQGRFNDELTIYREAMTKKPGDVTFLNNMAWTLSESMNRPTDGLKFIEQAIDRAGRSPQFLDTRGVIRARLGALDDAIKDLEVAAKAQPGGTSSLHLARVLLKAKKPAEARKAVDRGKAAGLPSAKLDDPERKEWDDLDASLPKS